MPRLFAAIEIPIDISRHLSCLRGGLSGARWIEAENYHITLQFFGDVTPLIADDIVAALDLIKSSTFYVRLRSVAVFTPKKPCSLYVAVEPCDALQALHQCVRRKIRHLDIVYDRHAFVPHITLARLHRVDMRDLAVYLERNVGFVTPTFKIENFVLISSRQFFGGRPYLVEASWPLGKG